jgi:glycosyltransferase involved in cell wall biosynthesis
VSASLPRVSVLLPAYNAEIWIGEAIASILGQTLSDLELIVIDDGSTDRTADVIHGFDDARIRSFRVPNEGIAAALNRGLTLARAPLAARQDADDLSELDRLKAQVDFLDAQPRTAVVGTDYTIIDGQGRRLHRTSLFTSSDDLRFGQVFANQFCHGSVMFRTDVIRDVGGYDTAMVPAEDYDLFSRVTRDWSVANLRVPLYRWRDHPSGTSVTRRDPMDVLVSLIQQREFEHFVAHRPRYRVYSSFHPRSTSGGVRDYLVRKGHLFRNLAFAHAQRGRRGPAITALWMAAIYEPWRRRNYRAMLRVARGAIGDSVMEMELKSRSTADPTS